MHARHQRIELVTLAKMKKKTDQFFRERNLFCRHPNTAEDDPVLNKRGLLVRGFPRDPEFKRPMSVQPVQEDPKSQPVQPAQPVPEDPKAPHEDEPLPVQEEEYLTFLSWEWISAYMSREDGSRMNPAGLSRMATKILGEYEGDGSLKKKREVAVAKGTPLGHPITVPFVNQEKVKQEAIRMKGELRGYMTIPAFMAFCDPKVLEYFPDDAPHADDSPSTANRQPKRRKITKAPKATTSFELTPPSPEDDKNEAPDDKDEEYPLTMTASQIKYIFKNFCHDDPNNPDDKWVWATVYSRGIMDAALMDKRLKFGTMMTSPTSRFADRMDPSGDWCYKNVVYIDAVNTVLFNKGRLNTAGRTLSANEKVWMSLLSKKSIYNAPRSAHHTQRHNGETKYHYMVVMYRGVLAVHHYGGEWQENKANVVSFIQNDLGPIISKMIEGRLDQGRDGAMPKYIWTDRGPAWGNTHPHNGQIHPEVVDALAGLGMEHFFGNDFRELPGRSGDIHPHETTISFLKATLRKVKSYMWLGTEKETVEHFQGRLDRAVSYVNTKYRQSMKRLCAHLPKRMAELVESKGARLKF